MKNYAVIGLGFGDEGKGKVVSSLCEKHKDENCIVVRYSGGSQASHKVIIDGKEHIFSSFGSGTFQDVPTFWSKYCAFDPLSFVNEYKDLILKNKKPLIFIHPKCPITTPYEILANQKCKRTMSDGTCGQGIGKTFQREEDWYSLLFEDLYYPKVVEQKLLNISKYYGFELDKELLDNFLNVCYFISNEKSIKMREQIPENYDIAIYEGSQGLLLDQHNGFFPHVTRANVGLTNIFEMTFDLDAVYYVTRSYLTKHGNGNDIVMNEVEYVNKHEHNHFNEWQGRFKTGVLNLDLIKYAMMKNSHTKHIGVKYVVVNCMDIRQEGKEKYIYIENGVTWAAESETSFLSSIMKAGNFNNLYTSDDAKELVKL